jgi:dTMP kinase
MAGRFISFEGIDGSGKSTQLRRLAASLRAAGADVVETREPGGAPGAELIRGLLVAGDAGRWSPETECLLFTAARRDHLERTILPALARGATVVSDRFADSTRVYQGVARAGLRPMVDALHDLAIGTDPDLTLILDLDPELALARGLARDHPEDRFERMGADFHARLRQGFLALAAEFPDRCRVIPADGDPDTVAARVAAAVAATAPATRAARTMAP